MKPSNYKLHRLAPKKCKPCRVYPQVLDLLVVHDSCAPRSRLLMLSCGCRCPRMPSVSGRQWLVLQPASIGAAHCASFLCKDCTLSPLCCSWCSALLKSSGTSRVLLPDFECIFSCRRRRVLLWRATASHRHFLSQYLCCELRRFTACWWRQLLLDSLFPHPSSDVWWQVSGFLLTNNVDNRLVVLFLALVLSDLSTAVQCSSLVYFTCGRICLRAIIGRL